MIYFYKKFKLLLLFSFIAYFFLEKNILSANYIRDTELEFAIDSWAEPIFKAANMDAKQIKIHIIADQKINAFVIDGNNMFINTGLITKAGSASGVIGVIAHEAGHISAGHILKIKEKIKNLSNNQFFTSLLGIGVLLVGAKSQTISRNDSAEIAKGILAIGPDISRRRFFAFSRANEFAADALGIKYLKKANRDPGALGIILEQLAGQELLISSRQDPFLRTHPLSRERLKFIRKHKLSDKIVEPNKDKILYKRLQSKINAFTDPPGKTLLVNKDNSIHQRYARAIAYFRIPMYEEAILSINSLLKDYPSDPYFLELKGQIYAENGKIENAINAYKKSLSVIEKPAPLIMIALANMLLERRNSSSSYTNAKNLLEKTIFLEPNNILAWHLKGIAHNKLNEKNLADLSAAEEFLIRRDFNRSKYFAERVVKNTKTNSPESIRANDILNIVN
tara:strand:- start:341 stop:1693 length:1353 start_codon:yes stop_codon:yes gene_type:complete